MTKKQHHRKAPTLGTSLLRGWGVMLAVGALLLLALTAIAYGAEDPSSKITSFATLALVVLAVTSGFASAAFYRKNGLLIGLLAGAGLTVLLLAFSIAGGSGAPITGRLLSYLLVLVLSTLGGLLGGAKRTKRRRRLR